MKHLFYSSIVAPRVSIFIVCEATKKMVNIITKKREEKLNLFYDLDMTLQKHSDFKVNLHKILIPEFIEQKDSLYRKALTEVSNMGIYFSKPKIFEDVARIPIEAYPFSTNPRI